ncbi:MAG: glycosyltransferase family 39 protein [Crocinitomicaceae bacterium]|nr:glycosyltransferase family 39 protein [Crocinitomicaceae bacterium]
MYTGVLVFILSCLTGWVSWQKFKQQQYQWAIFFLIILGLGLRIFLASDLFIHPWDERYHALVAKNMLQHPLTPTLYDNPILPYDYKQWTANHVWLHKQPVSLWGIMLSYMVFGINEFALRLPSVLLSTIGIWIMYRIGFRLFSRKVGYYSAFLYAIHGIIIEFVSGRTPTDHIDIFFLFFIQFAVLMAIEFSITKKSFYNISCGVLIGLALLTKWLPGLIVLPIWGCFLLHQKFSFRSILLHGTILCFTIATIVIPWQWYIFEYFPQEAIWESEFNRKHIFEYLDVKKQPILYHFNMLQINFGPFIYLPLIWIISKAIKRKTNWKYWGILIWILIPYIFFTLVKTKMQGYTLFAAPAIFLISGIFVSYLNFNKSHFSKKWLAPVVILILFALPIRLTVERLKPFKNESKTVEWKNEMINFSKHISSKQSVVVFNEPRPIEMMFYTDATAYDYLPKSEIIDSLLVEGHELYLNQEGLLIKIDRTTKVEW